MAASVPGSLPVAALELTDMARDIHAQSVPLPKFPMSAFDMGYSLKTCSQAGLMNPHYIEECIPGDIAHIKTDIFMRLDPLTFPIMHKVKIRQNFFFVPTRLILGDDLQEEFFSYKDMGAKLPAYRVAPAVQGLFLGKNSLFDLAGCQPVSGSGTTPCLVRDPLPFWMYQKIWLDFYADEIYNSQDITLLENALDNYRSVGLDGIITLDAGTVEAPLSIRRVSYSKDRFTSAQPDAQRVGEVYVMNPLELEKVDGSPISQAKGLYVSADGQTYINDSDRKVMRSTLTIDELWDEMAVQRFLNSMNEFGNERYIEILAGQYGVLSQDARLQRSQWLAGNEMVVNISEVLQTSETSEGSPLGALGGRGIVSGRGRDIAFRVPEHGFIIGILTIVPENGYASGSPRWLYKATPMDFALPRFNNLGEQAVYNGELYSDHLESNSNDLDEFGYQPQYDEYRSHDSRSVGDFREDQFLAWHLDRKFTAVPPLNEDFIKIKPDETNRIFNDTDPLSYHYRVHCFHKAMYVRPISKHPIPGKL